VTHALIKSLHAELNPAIKGKKLFIERLNPNQNDLRGSAQIFVFRNKESRITLGQQMKENWSKRRLLLRGIVCHKSITE
jgi:hypothetical protein